MFGVIAIGHLLVHEPLIFLNYVKYPGMDYEDFFLASKNITHTRSPYDIPGDRYVTTPIPAIMNIPLTFLGFQRARTILFVLIPLSVAFSFWMASSLYPFSLWERNIVLLAGFVSMLLGYPFYFLIERGNIDGWVMLFLTAGLFVYQKWENKWGSGLLFALAIMFKAYPILLFIPLVLYRKWPWLLWVCFWLLILMIISFPWIGEYYSVLHSRAQGFRFDENGSLIATVALLVIFLGFLNVSIASTGIVFAPFIAAVVYGILISIVIYVDYKQSKRKKFDISVVMMYFPFMVALPKTVYPYSLVICMLLLPMVVYLWKKSIRKYQRIWLAAILLGVSLMQWQAIALNKLTQNILAHLIPGLGLLIVMIGISAYKMVSLRMTPLEGFHGTTPFISTLFPRSESR